ncbi:MAG: DUF3014 domain-containing protein [Gammaproteobacteria bacterium]|nr:DUF3014 domain-containing protein [Gammaproteobacteria bacterium]
MSKSQIGILAIIALIAISAISYFVMNLKDDPDEEVAPVDVGSMQEEKIIRFPIPESTPPASEPEMPASVVKPDVIVPAAPPVFTVTAKIPLLADSDETLLSVLSQLIDLDQLAKLFQVKSIIERIVITVDNMTLRTLPPKHALVQPPKGKFKVIEKEDYQYILNEKNFKRYTPYVDFIEKANIKDLVTVYVHFYPLFQEVYESLGYPDSYFNDRLIEVINHLQETPEVVGPIELQRPHVFYIYADPALEGLSAGQRTLLRMGADNTGRLKQVLLNLRDEILHRIQR